MIETLLATQTPPGDIGLRLMLALALGAIVGFEREARNKPAGLRTYMLVSLAASTFTLLSIEMTNITDGLGSSVRADPIRAMEAIVTGVAFLGAGTIIQSRSGVRGITTGAGMWLAGAIGLACGMGSFVIAAIVTVLSFVVLFVIGRMEQRLKSDGSEVRRDGEIGRGT